MRICPGTPSFLHRALLQPFLEGVERVNLAWQGVDFHKIYPTQLPWQNRIVFFLTGTVLLVPFLNTLTWIFWEALGSPNHLSEPYSPEIPPATPLPIIPLPSRATSQTKPVETFIYRQDVRHGEGKIDVSFEMDRGDHFIFLKQISAVETSTAIYERNGEISSYQQVVGNGKFLVTWNVKRQLEVFREGKEKKILAPPAGFTWIQQPQFGLRNFLSSAGTTLDFYSILPENPVSSMLATPLLLKCRATKKGIEKVDGVPLLKVEVTRTESPYSMARAGEYWFDPQTFALKKFIEPGMLGSTKKGGVLLQHHPLPALERPLSPAHSPHAPHP